LNDYLGAAKGLEKFASDVPGSPFIVTYLLEAARIYERAGELDKSAQLWESLPDRFSGDPSMSNAWFQAGIIRYRRGNYPRANQDFQSALLLAKEPGDRARALLWVGKTYAVTGDTKNAQSAWQQAQAVDSSGYYSLRARDLLDGRDVFAAPPTMKLNYDLTTERTEAASWTRIKFNLPAETDLSNPRSLTADSRFQRGTEFWSLGEYDLARLEFENLREAVKTNAADSFRLGNYLLDLGAYRPAIFALREVLNLAGLDDHSASLTAPAYFMHVRYGLYYADIIWPAAAENGFDPLFITSLIRQESLFEGFVRSNAGARGLMQIIPDTGASVANQMGWPPDYTANDLYSPYISIRMGTYYLDANRRLLNGDLYAALAAYNGGPGNASIWQSLAKGDLDLELEIIRFGETRNYIRAIYETYTTYRGLYSPMQ
jgi:soluble lytic murein transglycosylase